MDREKLEKGYQKVAFVSTALQATIKRLEQQRAAMQELYGETPITASYDRDIAYVQELISTIGKYLGVCDEWKIMELLYEIRADEKSLMDERFTEGLKKGKEKAIRKRIEKGWKQIHKIEEKKNKGK